MTDRHLVPTPQAGASLPAIVQSPGELLSELARIFPPQIGAAKDLRDLLQSYAFLLGDHPEPVLRESYRILALTRRFPGFPMPGEIAECLLSAYAKLSLPLSPDAERLLDDRQAADVSRHVPGKDGRKRFVPSIVIEKIEGHWITGRHGNEVIDAWAGVTVADVEQGVREAAEKLKPTTQTIENASGRSITVKVDVDIAEAMKRITELARQTAMFRTHGKPEALCGGPVEISQRYAAVSKTFVSDMAQRHGGMLYPDQEPAVLFETIKRWVTGLLRGLASRVDWSAAPDAPPVLGRAETDEHGRQVYAQVNPHHYGTTLHTEIEALIELTLRAGAEVERRRQQLIARAEALRPQFAALLPELMTAAGHLGDRAIAKPDTNRRSVSDDVAVLSALDAHPVDHVRTALRLLGLHHSRMQAITFDEALATASHAMTQADAVRAEHTPLARQLLAQGASRLHDWLTDEDALLHALAEHPADRVRRAVDLHMDRFQCPFGYCLSKAEREEPGYAATDWGAPRKTAKAQQPRASAPPKVDHPDQH